MNEIIGNFGGSDESRATVNQLQELLYRPLLETLHSFDNSSDTLRLIFEDEAGRTAANDAALYDRLEFAP